MNITHWICFKEHKNKQIHTWFEYTPYFHTSYYRFSFIYLFYIIFLHIHPLLFGFSCFFFFRLPVMENLNKPVASVQSSCRPGILLCCVGIPSSAFIISHLPRGISYVIISHLLIYQPSSVAIIYLFCACSLSYSSSVFFFFSHFTFLPDYYSIILLFCCWTSFHCIFP